MRKLLFFVLLFLTKLSICQDFEISPMKLNYNAEPGESQTKYLIVKNHSSRIETFILKLSDYSVNSKGEGSFEEAGSLKNSIANWISFAPSFFELQPNEEKEIAVTIQQPSNEFSSKWGIIFINTAKEQTSYSVDKTLAAGMHISPRVGVDVFQTPGSNKSYKATINNLTEISTVEDSLRTFSAVVNNLEEIITSCKVYLIATDVASSEEFNYPSKEFTMYPKTTRKIELYLPKGLPKGTYALAAILDYGSMENLEGTQIVITVE